MNVSGIVVGLVPGAFDRAVADLGALPGVQVHHHDRPGHRVVVTQEAASADLLEEGLRRIQQLPGVVHAALVYHFFDDGPEPQAAAADQVLIQLGGRK
jgi:periplasmic nitrate reductase NapD